MTSKQTPWVFAVVVVVCFVVLGIKVRASSMPELYR
jgi:hypothetical protein